MKSRIRSLPAAGYCLVAILVLVAGWGGPAFANGTKKTVTALTTIYKPIIDNEPSDYVRVVIDGLDKTTVDSATIKIKRAKQTFDYTVVPLNNIASAIPALGMTLMKPGRIDFRLPLTFPDPNKPKDRQTFKQGDEVTLTINYNKDFSNDPAKGKYQPRSAIFRLSTVVASR